MSEKTINHNNTKQRRTNPKSTKSNMSEQSITSNNFLEGYRLVAKRVESPVCRTPLEDKCRLVADWEPQQCCWVGTPSNKNLWSQDAKPGIEATAQLAAAVSQFEPTTVCVATQFWEEFRELLPNHIRVVEVATNDAWIRHSGPTFLQTKTGDVRGVQWGNCGSGGKNISRLLRWKEDTLFARKLLEMERLYRYECIKVFIEAASFDCDGQGTILATEECMFHAGRKGGLDLDKPGFEHLLASYLAVEKVIWVPSGLYGDKYSNGHVSGLCRFVRPGVVVLSWYDTPDESETGHLADYKRHQAAVCKKALHRLTREQDAHGNLLEIHKIPFPTQPLVLDESDLPVEGIEGHPLHNAGDLIPISYTTFAIVNGGIVLPAYGDVQDRNVLKVVRKLFPKRRVVQYYARAISASGLTVRCVTLSIPKGAKGGLTQSINDGSHSSRSHQSAQGNTSNQIRRRSIDIGPVPEALPGTTISQYTAQLAHKKELEKQRKVLVKRVRAVPAANTLEQPKPKEQTTEPSKDEETRELSQIEIAQRQWLAAEGKSPDDIKQVKLSRSDSKNGDNQVEQDDQPLPPPDVAFDELHLDQTESDADSDALPPPPDDVQSDSDVSRDSCSSPNVAEDDAPLEDFGGGLDDEQRNVKFSMD